MTDRELIRIAASLLTDEEFRVWIAHHVDGKGRRSGSLALGISEDQWRYRLRNAHAKIATETQEAA